MTSLEYLLRAAVARHPLPWRTEVDWTCEVTAADGSVVVKCMSGADAQAIIDAAAEMAALDARLSAVIEEALASDHPYETLTAAVRAAEEGS